MIFFDKSTGNARRAVWNQLGAVCLLAGALSACGGGGGSGESVNAASAANTASVMHMSSATGTGSTAAKTSSSQVPGPKMAANRIAESQCEGRNLEKARTKRMTGGTSVKARHNMHPCPA